MKNGHEHTWRITEYPQVFPGSPYATVVCDGCGSSTTTVPQQLLFRAVLRWRRDPTSTDNLRMFADLLIEGEMRQFKKSREQAIEHYGGDDT